MSRRGMMIVVSGFSGVGKGTLVRLLTERYENYSISVSVTTRKPRAGDQEGKEYFFKTNEEFEELLRSDRLIEYAEYCGNYYGTPRDYVEQELSKGRDVILEIEQQGGLKVKKQYPDALMVFVMPPDINALVERLHGRGTESEEVIEKRLAQAVEESRVITQYEYMIINDDLDKSVEELHELIESQHKKIDRNMEFVEQIQKDLKQL